MYGMVNKDVGILTTPLQKQIPSQIRENAIRSYEEHNRRVRQSIPSHLLLEYNISDGWEPLCTFLHVADCPKTPFPKTNSSLSVIVQTLTGLIIAAVSTLLGLYLLYHIVCKIARVLNAPPHSKFHNGTTKPKKKIA